ncbi:MAG TPA: DUF488 domain-containing protein [Candidatus Cybelea sp.]|nr:DUF488 domain-containing protein [Candidatus Cybelea sp.]
MPEPAGEHLTIHTIGHSTHPLPALIALLRQNGIVRLIDVRTVPRSRHNPQYDRATLPQSLAAEGIAYAHQPALGGLRRPKPDSVNAGWRNAGFRGFADYMQTPAFENAIEQLISDARRDPLVIMCAEAVPWRCHRSLIADALTVRGIDVRHIIDAKPPHAHALTPFAKVSGQQISYPTEAPDLFRRT